MSFFWRQVLGHPPPWEPLCDEHDLAYRAGGSLWCKAVSDWDLASGIWDMLFAKRRPDFWFWPIVMFVAVRVGGVWWLPFPTVVPQEDGSWKWSWTSVRWGFGHPYPFYQAEQTWGDLLYPRAMAVIITLLLCIVGR